MTADQGSVAEAYRSLDALQVRMQTHRLYSRRQDDTYADVIAFGSIETDDDLLDVGCGTGELLRRLRERGHHGRLVGADIAEGSLRASAEYADEVHEAPATALPFADASWDVVTAMHMLYHVDDPMLAVREARRVLRKGGRYIATVNHHPSMGRIAHLVKEALRSNGIAPGEDINARVNSANLPPMLREVFGEVEVLTRDNAIVIPCAAPVLAYAESILSLYGAPESHPAREAVTDHLAGAVAAHFRSHDTWEDPKGYVVCVAVAGG